MQTKVCSRCKIDKPFSEYFKDNRRAVGIRCRCKLCCRTDTVTWRERNRSAYNNYAAQWRAKNPGRQHATDIKRNYGLSIDEYNALLAAQACRCKICGSQHDPARKRGRLYVDHCHKTGGVRALLCKNCNTGLGYFQDSPAVLEQALAYLRSAVQSPHN